MIATKIIAQRMRKAASRLFDRRIIPAHGPTASGQKIDTHSGLARLEQLSAKATLLILAGVLVEIAFIIYYPHDWPTVISTVVANGAIGLGLVIEYFVILKAIVVSEEAQRTSDEKIAEANKAAAEAHLETERLKAQFAGRRLSAEQRSAIVTSIRDVLGLLDVLIEYREGDPEAYTYGSDIAQMFKEAGIDKVRVGPVIFLIGEGGFGLHLSADDGFVASSVAEAFRHVGATIAVDPGDLSKHVPAGRTVPSLYIFVGAKLADEATIASWRAPIAAAQDPA
jgi:hypothetical protein